MARHRKHPRKVSSSFGAAAPFVTRGARTLRLSSAYQRGLRIEALECRWALSVSPLSADGFDFDEDQEGTSSALSYAIGLTGPTDNVVGHDPLDEPSSDHDHVDHDQAIQFDAYGNEFYADPVFYENEPTLTGGLSPEGAPPFPLDNTFKLHSNPGATKVIYLDFDGHTTTGTLWNDTYGATIVTPAYSFQGGSDFSTAELERIQRVWERVMEDFLPFDVDVTTEDPGVAALSKSGAGDTEWGVRVVIGENTWYSDAGGVAYIGSFNWSSDTPVYVFNSGETGIAEAASHEVGHALGLRHDGRGTPSETYYAGHGSGATSWAPIMGVGYDTSVTQWSRGEYPSANNKEDDLDIITNPSRGPNNGFGYRLDDHSGSQAGATPLVSAEGELIATSGIIEKRTDVDYFVFSTSGGPINIDVNPFYRSPNLDILISLYDVVGGLIASSNPLSLLSANIVTSLAAGTYYLSVDGVGHTGDGASGPDYGYSDYGSLGYYTITGSVGSPAIPTVTVTPLKTNDTTPALGGTTNDIVATITVDVGDQTGLLAVNNGDGTWTLPDNVLAALPAGVYDVVVRAVNPTLIEGFDESIDELTIDLTPPVVTVNALTTNNRSPELTGSIDDPEASVFVTVASQAGLFAINNGDGSWTLPAGTLEALDAGVYDVQVAAVDVAQNTGFDSTTGELAVNVPPKVTVGTLLTTDATPDLSGTIDDPAATLVVDVAGQVGLPAVNNGDGTWTLSGASLSPLGSGVYEVVVTATNIYSITGQDTTSAELKITTGNGPYTVTNGQSIALPGADSIGVGGEYPSTIRVAGMTADVLRVTVTLNDLSHTFPDDLDILLVGPGGTAVMLMSDAGGSIPAIDLDLTFDDSAPSAVPDAGSLTSGAFRPASYSGSETLPAPAPVLPYFGLLDAFTGISPNGAWRLYAVDDAGADVGAIAGGWTLSFEVGVDVTPPAVTVDRLTTSDTTPAITGTVNDPTATIVVSIAGPSGPVQSGLVATNNGDGTWTLAGELLNALTLGAYDVSVAATDRAGNVGLDTTFNELVLATLPSSSTFANSTPILLPGVGTNGVAGAYPSVITVSGVATAPVVVRVTLHGLSHTYPDDLDILLVGPYGQTVVLMSDAGGSNDATDVTLVFDDSASVTVPDSGTLTSGSYRPRDYEFDGALPTPAPSGPYGATLSVLEGINPNGNWSLYVYDDSTGDSGVISGGWSLELASSRSDDHGNSADSATSVAAPSVTSGVLEVEGDVDYFAFTAEAGAEFVFSVALGSLEDSTLTLYDTDGSTSLLYDDDGGDGRASRIEWTAPSSGVYYLAVRGFGDTHAGGYILDVEAEAVVGGDDHGNSFQTATSVTIPSTTGGVLEGVDDVDYFAITAVKGVLYRLSTTLDSLEDSTLTLYDADGSTELDFDDDGGGDLASAILWQAPAGGVHYAAVRSFDATYLGAYRFQILSDETPGDYNGDLVVDAADYTFYRDTLGQSVAAPFDGADGDGDGVVTEADRDVWRNNYGATYASESVPEKKGAAPAPLASDGAIDVARVTRNSYTARLREVFSERDAVFVNYQPSGVVQRTPQVTPGSRATLSTAAHRDQALRLLSAPSGAPSEAAPEEYLCGGGRVPQEDPSDAENSEGVFPGSVGIATSLSAS